VQREDDLSPILTTPSLVLIISKKRPPAQPDLQAAMATTTVIHKRGDVILKPRPHEGTAAVFLVSSVILSLASPVFEAMFSGNFAEGQALSVNSPREVPLPDDDLQSMLLICNITHMQTPALPKKLSIDDFANFATTCDKYQCIEAVEAWSKVWAANIFQDPVSDKFESMILATYVLDIPHEFYQAVIMITRDQSTDAVVVATEFLPMVLFDNLHAIRRKTDKQFSTALDTVTRNLGCCKASQTVIGEFMVNLRAAGLWPLTSRAVSDLRTRVNIMAEDSKFECNAVKISGPGRGRRIGSSSGCCCQTGSSIMTKLAVELNDFYNSIPGLCLDCIKKLASEDTRECRIRHDDAGVLIHELSAQ
jgi:hypothetical protein